MRAGDRRVAAHTLNDANFQVHGGLVYYRNKLYVPAASKITETDDHLGEIKVRLRDAILIRAHLMSLHSRANRVKDLASELFSWPHIAADAEECVYNCPDCNWYHKDEDSCGVFRHESLMRYLYAVLYIDHITDLKKKDGYDSILRVREGLIGLTWLIAVKGTGLAEVKRVLTLFVFAEVGYPDMIRADNAFAPLGDWLRGLGVTLKCGEEGNPRSTNLVEQPNFLDKERILKTCRCLDNWPSAVPLLQLLARSHRPRGGLSELERLSGTNGRLPGQQCGPRKPSCTLPEHEILKELESIRKTLVSEAADRNLEGNLARLRKRGSTGLHDIRPNDVVLRRDAYRSKRALTAGPDRCGSVYLVVDRVGDQLRLRDLTKEILTIDGGQHQLGSQSLDSKKVTVDTEKRADDIRTGHARNYIRISAGLKSIYKVFQEPTRMETEEGPSEVFGVNLMTGGCLVRRKGEGSKIRSKITYYEVAPRYSLSSIWKAI